MDPISLNGIWKATDNLGLQAKAGQVGYDDSAWIDLPVPGHWQQVPAFSKHAGRLLYRTSFEWPAATPGAGEAVRLRFDGIFYAAKVWFNGTFLGEHEGYFASESYDITRHVRPGPNAVMVEVDCPAETDPENKRMVTGVFSHWHAKDPEAEPGGIWRGVYIDTYHGLVPEAFHMKAELERVPPGPLSPDEYDRLAAVGAVDPVMATDPGTAASVAFGLEFMALAEGRISWKATIRPETFDGEPTTLSGNMPAKRGWNQIEASCSIPDPQLWWTWDHGRPDLYRFVLEVQHEAAPPVRFERVFGIRKVEMRNWHYYLNGRRIFIRGTNYGPADMRLATVKPDLYKQDLELMRGANLNMLRVHAHIDRPELYEEASRQGMLIWQDFPLQGSYARSVIPEAKRQAALMVRELGHWPAIGAWCCRNEPSGPDTGGALAATISLLKAPARANPDPAVAAVIRKLDKTRPVIDRSGDFGLLWGGTDTHQYWGWYRGRMEEVERVLRYFPHVVRFVTEYGAQAFPVMESTAKLVRGRWPDINWDDLSDRRMLQAEVMERHVPANMSPTLEHYVAESQHYQAALLKYMTEALRRMKYRPCGGAMQFLFTDSSPGVSFSVVDYWRKPKLGYEALKRAMNPLYICCEPLRPAYPGGSDISIGVYLLNDRYRPARGHWSWQIVKAGEVLAEETRPAYIPPDGLVIVSGGVSWKLPVEVSPGAAELRLRLEIEGEEPVTNGYLLAISARVR